MAIEIKTFSLFVRDDETSRKIADRIRELNWFSKDPWLETDDGDLILVIGGDGMFLRAINQTTFSKDHPKLYAGIHTGTLGFLQNFSPDDVFNLIKYLHENDKIKTRRVYLPTICVCMERGNHFDLRAINEIFIGGKNYTDIKFQEYVQDHFLQKICGNGIIISSQTGDTAWSLNNGGAIDFTDHFQLSCKPVIPTQNAVNERFISNPIICFRVKIIPTVPQENITIITDGIVHDEIPSGEIKSIDVSISRKSDFIQKVEWPDHNFSKAETLREKILHASTN